MLVQTCCAMYRAPYSALCHRFYDADVTHKDAEQDANWAWPHWGHEGQAGWVGRSGTGRRGRGGGCVGRGRDVIF